MMHNFLNDIVLGNKYIREKSELDSTLNQDIIIPMSKPITVENTMLLFEFLNC